MEYKKLVEEQFDQLVNDLKGYIQVPSVREDDKATDQYPVGPGPFNALDYFLKLGDRDGFVTKNIDNLVGYIEYQPEGADDNYIALLAHADVVPAGDGWTKAPFEATIEDNKIYGRGSSDDKGPGLAAYYALKIIRDQKMPIKHKIRLVIGTDEESDWIDMKRYFEVEPQPLMGFAPDAEFPIINGEKGLGQFTATFDANNSGDLQLLAFDAGERTNMVPGVATAKVQGLPDDIESQFNSFLSDQKMTGEVKVTGDIAEFTINGKQVHGAMPETGINAATFLNNFLSQFDFGGSAKNFVDFVGVKAHNTTDGDNLGIKTHSDKMGDLSMNVGIAKFVDGQQAVIDINIRYPENIDDKTIIEKLDSQLEGASFEGSPHNLPPHFVDPSDPLVVKLLDIFHKQTGLPAHDMVIGGGTYGRTMDRGVAYGAMFEGDQDTMHQADEFMPLDRLKQTTEIYTEAIYEVANLD